MHREEDDSMDDIHWKVGGESSAELYGFLEDQREPVVRVSTGGSGQWTFTFRDFDGHGKIQVTKGCDYNPLDLIESLLHHLKGRDEVPVAISPDTPMVEWSEEASTRPFLGDEWL
jgi:hypothetical protein